jgi:Protein of unknown function with HXXEE motif
VLGKNPNLTRIAFQHATESDQIRKKCRANNMSNNQRFGIVKEEIDTWVAAEAIVAVTERLVNRYLLTGEKTEKELGEQVAQMFLSIRKVVIKVILEWLDSRLHIISVLWLFPILFMFHDFEEILTVEKWMKHNKEQVLAVLPKSARKFFYSSFQMTTVQFAEDVFWIFLAITIATVLAVIFSFYYTFFTMMFVFLEQLVLLYCKYRFGG